MILSRDAMNNLHFFCSVIELIARQTDKTRADVIKQFSLQDIEDELELAEVNHCLPVERIVSEYIERYGISKGTHSHDPKVCETFRYSQIGRFLQNYIVSVVENKGCPLAATVRDVLSSSLEELFVGIE